VEMFKHSYSAYHDKDTGSIQTSCVGQRSNGTAFLLSVSFQQWSTLIHLLNTGIT